MYKQYKGEFFPKIEVKEFFDGDYNKIAQTLGYKSFQEVLKEQSKTYNLNRHDPFLIPDMEKLVNRLQYHIKKNSNILVFGDFDVDGISASAVLIKGLYYAGAENIDVIIPNREIGYSIKREYILEYINNPKNKYPDVIVTVDCGIKSAADIEYIVDMLGIEVLVTDHHGVDEHELPLKASACVNPHRKESKYPFKEISGSMVSLKVIEALEVYIEKTTGFEAFKTGPQGRTNGVMDELQELAMLGTVADVMPILNENKWLVKDTLTRLGYSKNLGLRVFTNRLSAEYNDSGRGLINTDFIGWQIGPRINAAGRIGNPTLGLYMFLTDDKITADSIFDSLNSTNKQRQEILAEDYDVAVNYVKDTLNGNKGIVYVDTSLADGIIGLIAGRLKEEFYRPTIAIGGRATVVDILYNEKFTQEESVRLYKVLYALNDRFFKQHNTELFFGSSIKDFQKIMFSLSESNIDFIENEILSIFKDIKGFVNSNLLYINQDERNKVINLLSGINYKSFRFDYYTVLKGSCRSVPGFDITAGLDYINKLYKKDTGMSLLLGFGGHPLAAGFGLTEDKVADFKYYFEMYANSVINDELLKKELSVNVEIRDFSYINEKLVNNIYSMGPYGNRNEYPKILAVGRPVYAEVIGRKKTTVKMILEDRRGMKLEMLFFRYKDNEVIKNFCEGILNNAEYKKYYYGIVGTLAISEYNNIKTVQLKPIDIVYEI